MFVIYHPLITNVCTYAYVATQSTTLLESPTQSISPRQHSQQQHGPDWLVVHQKNPEEKFKEMQPQETTNNGSGDEHGEHIHIHIYVLNT